MKSRYLCDKEVRKYKESISLKANKIYRLQLKGEKKFDQNQKNIQIFQFYLECRSFTGKYLFFDFNGYCYFTNKQNQSCLYLQIFLCRAIKKIKKIKFIIYSNSPTTKMINSIKHWSVITICSCLRFPVTWHINEYY